MKRAARNRLDVEALEEDKPTMRYEWRVPSSPLGHLEGKCTTRAQAIAEAERIERLVAAKLWTYPPGHA